MNRVFNEEQFEAYQEEVNRKVEDYINSLPETAKAKAIEVRRVVGDLNKIGTPYYLFIQEPCEFGYHWPVQYNNLLEVFPTKNGKLDSSSNGAFNANFFYALIAFFSQSFSQVNNSGKHPLQILWEFITSSIMVMEDPVYEEELKGFTKKMNEIWGVELEHFKPKSHE